MRKLLTLRDLLLILQISEPTLRRWLSEARRGQNSLPLHVSDLGRKLLWNPADIENWVSSRQQPPVSNFESSTERKKRHTAAMQSLKQKGVALPSQQQGAK